MSGPTFLRTALAATLAAGACAAHATTMELDSWTYGSGGNVNTSTPSYSGQAGGFSGTLDGKALQTYCVELTQEFYWGVAYTSYTDVSAASYFSADKLGKLEHLISYVSDNASAVDNAAKSTSLQLAIWNIVYDTDLTLSSYAGALFSDSSSYASYANTLLGASQSWADTVDLYVLSSPTQQDQLHWTHHVPEPASLALALAALGGAGFATRKRKAAA